MIVVDVETTGTNSVKHSLISIGAVDMLRPQDTFYEECYIWENAHVDPEALEVNGMTEEQIRDTSKFSEKEIIRHFFAWFEDREVKIIAAHNPIFDISFIQDAADRGDVDFPLASRSIDLHSVCFAHMKWMGVEPVIKGGKSQLNSEAVSRYVGIPVEPKPHNGLNGALWEAEAFSRLLHNKTLLDQFKQYPIPWV